jgi:uncharacterized protein (TIGR02246 family)
MARSDADEEARDLYRRLLEAWNARDEQEYAGLFSPDAMLIGFDGSQLAGAQVADHLGSIFADHSTAAYVAKVREVRSVGADAVLLRAIVGMVPPGLRTLNPATNAVQTLLAERHDGDWRIVLFQNTPAQYHGQPATADHHVAELEPLAAGGVTLG